MRVAYFDCFSGVSGDMILGSLIDAGLKVEDLRGELEKISLTGYEIRVAKVERKGVWGTQVKVLVTNGGIERRLDDILGLIEESDLDEEIKRTGQEIFSRLAQVEAKIHHKRVNEVHFHELGATDALVDVVGALVGVKLLGIERVYASRLSLGTGFLKCAHGTLPVPAPATLKLLEGVPVRLTGIEGELVTPTGAAVITALARDFGEPPPLKLQQIGYGVGHQDLPIPNLLRVLIGEAQADYEQDRVIMLETNIDDMNPQIYGHVVDLLFEAGAYDICLTPVQMKKGRPGVMLSVISPLDKTDELLRVMFQETTTLGIRVSEVRRVKLQREGRIVSTRFGEVRVKVSLLNGKVKDVVPEYDDCKRIAEEHHLPIREVYREVERVSWEG